MHHRDELIRKRAHQVWEDEGCPEGQDEAHRQRARAEIDGLASVGEQDQAVDARGPGDADAPEFR